MVKFTEIKLTDDMAQNITFDVSLGTSISLLKFIHTIDLTNTPETDVYLVNKL